MKERDGQLARAVSRIEELGRAFLGVLTALETQRGSLEDSERQLIVDGHIQSLLLARAHFAFIVKESALVGAKKRRRGCLRSISI